MSIEATPTVLHTEINVYLYAIGKVPYFYIYCLLWYSVDGKPAKFFIPMNGFNTSDINPLAK